MRVVLMSVILIAGCSWQTAATKTMTGLHESLKGTSAVGEKHYESKCVGLAKKCTAKPCKQATDCLDEFKKFNRIVLGARAAIHIGQAAVALGDKQSTMMILLKLQACASELKDLLIRSGVIP